MTMITKILAFIGAFVVAALFRGILKDPIILGRANPDTLWIHLALDGIIAICLVVLFSRLFLSKSDKS
jgi:hypothetical protein